MIRIAKTDLDLTYEKLNRPFGFKGSFFTRKWVAQVALTSDQAKVARDVAGFAVLWSDRDVFLDHTETGGNLLMGAVLEHALRLAKDVPFDDPIQLQDELLEPVHAYAQKVTQRQELRRTFTLNAMVALDNAAWRLYAAERNIDRFDALIPAPAKRALADQHRTLACMPLCSYNTELDEVSRLVAQGHFILKIKLGAPGSPDVMLDTDLKLLERIHQAVGTSQTPFTSDGKIRYYLDANGRYPDLDWVRRLRDGLERLGILEQVLLLEEPLPEHVHQPVGDLGMRIAADEQAHSVEDVIRCAELGYTALAMKPAGKTLSMTFRMAAQAAHRGLSCFVADSTCTPRMMDWNRNIAARLAALPGLTIGCLESNGPQNYVGWEAMRDSHPCAGESWLEPRDGLFQLNDSFYASSGGLFPP